MGGSLIWQLEEALISELAVRKRSSKLAPAKESMRLGKVLRAGISEETTELEATAAIRFGAKDETRLYQRPLS